VAVRQKNRNLFQVEAEYAKMQQMAKAKEKSVVETHEVYVKLKKMFKNARKVRRISLRVNKKMVMFAFNRNLTQKGMTGPWVSRGLASRMCTHVWGNVSRADALHARTHAKTHAARREVGGGRGERVSERETQHVRNTSAPAYMYARTHIHVHACDVPTYTCINRDDHVRRSKENYGANSANANGGRGDHTHTRTHTHTTDARMCLYLACAACLRDCMCKE